MRDEPPLYFRYTFALADGTAIEHEVALDPENLSQLTPYPDPLPEWTSLAFKQCDQCRNCTGDHCAVAASLVAPIEKFAHLTSITEADITVETPERTYFKHTDVQSGLGSLFGLLMATSGVRSLERFKPMARFHLPFATIEETVYRFASMMLMEGFFKRRSAVTVEFSAPDIQKIYAPIADVNQCVFARLRSAVRADATLNAVVALDCFTSLVPDSFEHGLEDLGKYFNA